MFKLTAMRFGGVCLTLIAGALIYIGCSRGSPHRCNFNRVNLPNGLTKWEIPCQLGENRVAACTSYCASIVNTLARDYHYPVDPRDYLTPVQAETMTRDAFDWGEEVFNSVLAMRRARGDRQANGRLEPNELSGTDVGALPVIRRNYDYGGEIKCAVGMLLQIPGYAQTVSQGITRALTAYRVVFIVSQNSYTSCFFRQGSSNNGFYVDTHTRPGADKRAGEITYGPIADLRDYLIARFGSQDGEMSLYGYGKNDRGFEGLPDRTFRKTRR